jgi:hypothetical protein
MGNKASGASVKVKVKVSAKVAGTDLGWSDEVLLY